MVRKYPVFSTYVEMILACEQDGRNAYCVLHVCGDDPKLCVTLNDSHQVFSTYVEMILNQMKPIAYLDCVLHVCGDDP